MADARAVAVAESTATLERHAPMSCAGTRDSNVWTRSVVVGGGAVASSVRTEIRMVPKTPLLSENEVVRVVVPPTWSARCFGSQMMRWSMHVAWTGWYIGVMVGVVAPSHFKTRRDWT
jgi:hypothetical protein